MKKFLSLLLAVMMVVSLLPVQALAEAAQSAETEQIAEPAAEPAAEAAQPQDGSTLVTTGNAGESITWSYDEATQVLTFTGKGEMLDNEEYDFETVAPYFLYPVKKVIVGEGITSLGTAMIYFGTDVTLDEDKGNDTVTEIELPSTLTSIHESAFGGFNKLEKLVIPDSVTTIGVQIIESSPGIKELVLPDSITTIYQQTYIPLQGLERAVIPKNVTEIPRYAFSNLKKLSYIELPEGLTQIGMRAFRNCTALKEIYIPANVTKIDQDAFAGWTADQTINIALTEEEAAEKVTFGIGWSGDATVKYGVKQGPKFSVTSNVENLNITIKKDNKTVVGVPYTMEEGIDDNCFFTLSSYANDNIGYRFKKLVLTIDGKSVTYNAGDAAIKYATLVSAFGDSFTFNSKSKTYSQISAGAFRIRGIAKSDVNVYIEFEEMGNKVGDDITWSYNETTKTLTFTGTGEMYDDNMLMTYATYPIEKVVIGEGITKVGQYKLAFVADAATKAHNTTIKSIEFPSTIKTFGSLAIGYLDGIEVFTLPEGIETVDSQLFMGCDGIKEVVLPSTLTGIGRVFAGLSNLERATIPAQITEIPSNAFSGRDMLTYVSLPEGLTTIGERAFNGCNAIKEINIPSTVTNIGASAFIDWTVTQTVRFPITEEEAKAKITFGSNWSDGATVRYKDDEDKFAGDHIRWQEMNIYKEIEFYGAGEMYDYTGKTTPWHAVKQNEIAFSGAITSIGAYSMAFDDPSAITKVTFDTQDALKVIKDGAFKGLTGVTELVVPTSVTEIGSEAFAGWTAEQTIRFEITEKEAKATIKFADDWNKDCAAKIAYKQDTKWANGMELYMTKDGNKIPMSVDLEHETVTVYAEEFEGTLNLAGTAVTGVLNGEEWNGTAVFSDNAAVEGANGKYTVAGTITLTSPVEGDAVLTLKLAFTEAGTFQKYGTLYLRKGSSIVDYYYYSQYKNLNRIVFTTNGSEITSGAKIEFNVYDGCTVTADKGTVTQSGINVTVELGEFAFGSSVNVTIKSRVGVERNVEFVMQQGYQVRINDSVGGEITVLQENGRSANSVAEGAIVCLKADPEPGMVVEEWVAEGANNSPVVVVNPEDPNTASFAMIAETVEVTAVFRTLKEGEKDTGFRIKSVTLDNGVAFIDEANSTVKILLDKGSDITKVKPIIEVTEGAEISPASGEEVDLSRTVTYTVSRNGGTHKYKFTAGVNSIEKGRGSKDDPFRIENVEDLKLFRDSVNAGTSYEGLYVVQTADLDLSEFGEAWVPIGTAKKTSGYSYEPDKAFMGTYDGQNHKILNMKYISEGADKAKGFFGTVKNATVKNLVIDASCSIKTSMYIGGVAGIAVNSTFENCVNGGSMYATAYATGLASDFRKSYSGGICGNADSASVFIKCRNSGSIACDSSISGWGYTGPDGTGGICGAGGVFMMCSNSGYINGGGATGGIGGAGTAIGCWNTGKIESSYTQSLGGTLDNVTSGIGGIVGSGTAENCYNKGYVSGNWTGVGGIAGRGTVNNSYNTGAVTSTYNGNFAAAVGSLLGYYKGNDELKNLYYVPMGESSAVGYSEQAAGSVIGKPVTQKQLQGTDVLEALMEYEPKLLQKAEWMADLNGSNEGYPVIIDYSVSRSSEKKITSAKLGARIGIIDEEKGTISFTVNYGMDISSLALNLVISTGASVYPASGERVDFSKGSVIYTVTAADGSKKEYTVTVNSPASADGLADLFIGYYDNMAFSTTDTSLIPDGEFSQDKYEYTVDMDDCRIYEGASTSLARFKIIPVPATRGAAVKASVNGGEEMLLENFSSSAKNQYVSKVVSYMDKLHPGKNTLVITVTNPGSTDSVTYTFNFVLHLTIKDFEITDGASTISPAFSPDVTEYTITIQDKVTELPVKYKGSFKEERGMIKITHPDGTIAFTQNDYSGSVYEGNVKITPEMSEFKITVEGTEKDSESKTYTFKLNRIGTYEAEFVSNAENAIIRVYDKNESKLAPDENGKYLFTRGETYSYTAAAKGYVSAAGTVSGPDELSDGKFMITLEKVSGIKYTDFDAYWPTFRGNDENMAITDKKTPTDSADTELVWAAQSGNGYGGGAVSSPIIVNGYIYAYAGTNIIKVDKQTGETLATGKMAGTSSFSIVPPTYADGMIFVGLSGGRIQAFRADTLESLWVYKDELGGQPNSRIVYKDGCVYIGFWNNETQDANFVCVDASDEDPNNSTEAKYALWTYTNKGGFYWAGAYASDKYVVVGTDDGDSGYKGSSHLLVFNKDTGEVVSSFEFTGDIRSDIAYDKATDRVYFTSKAGYFYSLSIDWSTGAIDAMSKKEIRLDGMSTSTPVVYNGRAYVGVCGTGQFVEYSGHNISVIDLASWEVAYKAYTKGYPQTSGLVSNAYVDSEGYTYVYFTENYTPGAVRYIRDKAGVSGVVGGTMEKGMVCAPVVYTPSENLAQYCICSPIVDEDGTVFFKNDTSYMMAIRVKAESIEIAEKPASVTENADGTISAEGLKVLAVLKNGEKIDVSAYVTVSKGENNTYTVTYTYGSDIAEGVKTLTASFTDDNKIAAEKVDELISAIGEVTLTDECKAKIDAARNAYDKLSDAQKALVKSYNTLTEAEAKYAELLAKREADEAAAKAVDELVNKLAPVTLESGKAIEEARKAFDALTPEQKQFLDKDTESKLVAAEKEYNRIVKEAADKKAAEKVDELISAIGEVTLTDECKAKIDAARSAYDKLTDAQKALVKSYNTLTEAEAKYAELLAKKEADEAAAKAVDELVDKLAPVNLESEAAIKEAREAFDALTPEQKQFLDKDTESKLVAAEKEYNRLVKEAADKKAAKAVDELVNKLAPVTLESGKAVEEARKAFAALTPEQKQFLDKDTESKLVAAENEYHRLVKEAADKAAAKEVEDKIAALQPVTKNSGDAIKDTRSSYDALTPEQKELVSKEAYDALVKAEKAYSMIVDSNKPDASDKGDKTTGSIIKISATGAEKGEQNPSTGAPAMSIAPAMLVLAAAVLVLKKRG